MPRGTDQGKSPQRPIFATRPPWAWHYNRMISTARISLLLLLTVGTVGELRSQSSQQANSRQPATIDSATRKLQDLQNKQQEATSSGDPAAVMASSQALTTLAMQQLEDVSTRLRHPSASTAESQRLKVRERQLRQILGSGFNDWGTAEAHEQQYAEALKHFQEAEKWNPSTPGLMRNLGTAAFEQEEYQESARALASVVSASPEDQRSRLMLAMSLFSLERFSDASKNFAPIGDLAMQDARTAYAWAYSLVRTDQPQQANAIADILAARNLSPDVHLLVCKLYTASANYEHALPCFRTITAENPEMPGVHYELGATLIHLDKPADAIPELRDELKINPRDIDAQYDLAYALSETSHKEEALPLLRSVLALNPNYSEAQYQLGKVLLEDGKTEEAIGHLETAARINPHDAFVHYQLQVAYRRAGRTEDANRELQLYKDIKANKRESESLASPKGGEPKAP
ncbi:tetratricopeptide repeat protein [Edaphobacter aggregans]|uniref:Tetratricopeptide repeat protein n=2 Tax=Edaphobacter aggregans TaxID=570835 RepID=A0A3R9WHJ9_9BACT|nr:tetratricopeptide repeat protein [Edaphobacter aggregans]